MPETPQAATSSLSIPEIRGVKPVGRSSGLGAWDLAQAPFLFIWAMTRACAVRRRDPGELTTDEAKRMLEAVRCGAPTRGPGRRVLAARMPPDLFG